MRRPNIFQSLSLLLAVSVVAGVIMAGMLVPFVGGAGEVVKSAANNFTIPAVFKRRALPLVSKVVDQNGNRIATFYDQDRFLVHLKNIPLQMQQALIDTEDVRFYEHSGIDWKGALRALLHNGSGGGTQGGSTLEQQYVKNVLVENARTKKQREAATADTLARKVKEARYAIYLDQHFTKAQILTDYFNIVYFGDGAYGLGAAAKRYFSENTNQLTLDQSALLAGLVQSPEAYNPVYYPTAAKARRDVVLGQMLKYHAISQETYDRAVAKPIKLSVHNQKSDCVSSTYPYFCEYVKNVFRTTPGLKPSMLQRGGLTVTTTLSPHIQKATQRGVREYVHAREPTGATSAEAVVQPGTGEVKALAVSTKFGYDKKKGENSLDYAVDKKYGGSPGFHAGSTFKLFVLTAALKEGIPISTRINAPATLTNFPGFTDCAGNNLIYNGTVSNSDAAEAGSYNLDTGTWDSVNTFFVQLEQRTGLCEPVKLAESMGVTQGTGKPPEQVPSFVLGSGAKYGFTPLDLAGAYATMAAHGMYCKPVVITSITDANGDTFPVPKPDCKQVVPEGLANTVTAILRGVLTQGTGVSDQLTGRPAAAKTGTVDNYDGSWFAGYTPQLASAVWVGIPSSPNESLGYKTIGGRPYGAVFGATIAGKIWQATFNAALANKPVAEFTGPSSYYSTGITTPIPNVAGQSTGSAAAVLRQDGFSPTVVAGEVPSSEPAGTVAMTSPSAYSSASPGATVLIYISNGKPVVTTSPTSGTSSSPPAKPSNQPTSTGNPKNH